MIIRKSDFKNFGMNCTFFGIGMLIFMADNTSKQTIGYQLNVFGVPKGQTKIWEALPLSFLKYQKVKSKFGDSFPPLLKKSNQIGSQ